MQARLVSGASCKVLMLLMQRHKEKTFRRIKLYKIHRRFILEVFDT